MASKTKQPRGIRNNNPGNIEWGSQWQGLRPEGDRAIADTDWLVTRHRDELDMLKVATVLPDEVEPVTTLSEDEYAELLRYRQALRDWPTVVGWSSKPMPEVLL